MWTSSIKIGIFYHFAADVRLSSSTVVGSFSYCSLLVPSFITTVIDATFSILEKSIHAFSTVIGLPRHVCVNFNKFQDKIPAPHSPLPAPRSHTTFSHPLGTYKHSSKYKRFSSTLKWLDFSMLLRQRCWISKTKGSFAEAA